MGKEVQWEEKPRRDPNKVCLQTDVESGKSPSATSHPRPGGRVHLLGPPLSLAPQGKATGPVE